ncbi:MAG: (d)CMP kinase [Candidatus Fimadaptatus sp.]|jgi:cytidylate kinase
MVIAIDGPAGAGKSDISKMLAARLGFAYLDTGAMYRAIALKALRGGVALDDSAALSDMLAHTELDVRCSREGAPEVVLDGEDVTGLLRTQQVGDAASRVSALKLVRQWLLEAQRSIARSGDVIMDGRDIGTEVLPDAEVKIYLTASCEVRARRRLAQLLQKGEHAGLDDVMREVRERDERDMTRDVSPLRQADDAVLVDSSDMTREEVVEAIMERVGAARKELDT